jgi:hypothetical protein
VDPDEPPTFSTVSAYIRRRRIDPTTCDFEYTPAELEFMAAMDSYKRQSGRLFPTWKEVLEVLTRLGYSKPVIA